MEFSVQLIDIDSDEARGGVDGEARLATDPQVAISDGVDDGVHDTFILISSTHTQQLLALALHATSQSRLITTSHLQDDCYNCHEDIELLALASYHGSILKDVEEIQGVLEDGRLVVDINYIHCQNPHRGLLIHNSTVLNKHTNIQSYSNTIFNSFTGVRLR